MSVKDPFQQLVDEITLIRQDMERLKRTSLDKDDAEALHEMLAEGVDRMRKVGPEVQKAVEMRLLGVAAVLREETANAAASKPWSVPARFDFAHHYAHFYEADAALYARVVAAPGGCLWRLTATASSRG